MYRRKALKGILPFQFVDKPRTDNWISQSARGFVQLPYLEVLIKSISEQLFAPRQTAEKPIVGA
jgi:hypothetical protein